MRGSQNDAPCLQVPKKCETNNSSSPRLCSLVDPRFGTLTPAGVALWGQHGGAALFQGGSHRTGEEAVPQQHRLPHAA